MTTCVLCDRITKSVHHRTITKEKVSAIAVFYANYRLILPSFSHIKGIESCEYCQMDVETAKHSCITSSKVDLLDVRSTESQGSCTTDGVSHVVACMLQPSLTTRELQV